MLTTSYPHSPPPPQPYQTTPGGLIHPAPSRRTRPKHRSIKAAKPPSEYTYEVDTARPKFGEQAVIKQAGSTYNPRKDDDTPTPPRWADIPAGLGKMPPADFKRRKALPGVHLKRDYETLNRPPRRREDFPSHVQSPTPVTERNKNDRLGFQQMPGSPLPLMINPAMLQQQRTDQHAFIERQQQHDVLAHQHQQAMSTYQQGRTGSQNSMANLKQGQAQQPRAMGNEQTWHDSFIYPPPNINESVVGNGRSVFDQYTAPRQRPETPPLTGFDVSPDSHSRTSRVSGPPASLPRHGITSTARGQAPSVNIPHHMLKQLDMNRQPRDPRHDAALTHPQVQQYQEMLMQQRQLAHQNVMKHYSNGLPPSPSSFYPEWGFGRDSNMLPSPSTFQTTVDPNGPSFARDDYAERKSKTFDQGNIPVQPNDERRDSPRPFKNTRTLCSVYRFPQGKVQSTISEDHTTDVSKRRKLNFMALGQSKSYGAKITQHPRRDAEPNGRMHALMKI